MVTTWINPWDLSEKNCPFVSVSDALLKRPLAVHPKVAKHTDPLNLRTLTKHLA